MKLLVAITSLIVLPLSAHGAEKIGDTGGFSLLSSSIQMLASLAVVIGIILVFHHLSKRWTKSTIMGKSLARHIRIVESRFLAPKKTLVLVEVAGEYLLLSSCGENLNFIKQIDMLENIEVIGDVADIPSREALWDKCKSLTTWIPTLTCGLRSMAKKGGISS
jgi:flagellar protein FliO/FliZ